LNNGKGFSKLSEPTERGRLPFNILWLLHYLMIYKRLVMGEMNKSCKISDSLHQRNYLKFQKLPTENPGKLLSHLLQTQISGILGEK